MTRLAESLRRPSSGADNASYFLALSLQDNNNIMGAIRLWMKIMSQPMGDRDASYLAFPHIRILLNVGLSIETDANNFARSR